MTHFSNRLLAGVFTFCCLTHCGYLCAQKLEMFNEDRLKVKGSLDSDAKSDSDYLRFSIRNETLDTIELQDVSLPWLNAWAVTLIVVDPSKRMVLEPDYVTSGSLLFETVSLRPNETIEGRLHISSMFANYSEIRGSGDLLLFWAMTLRDKPVGGVVLLPAID